MLETLKNPPPSQSTREIFHQDSIICKQLLSNLKDVLLDCLEFGNTVAFSQMTEQEQVELITTKANDILDFCFDDDKIGDVYS